ncbi:peptidase [Geothrix limicola]|uniref:Peptidase n=1 Tax=Geothrix limicola TaxID=2927978 RepID=A0ABQ5QBE0_9BACT|nr:penicillin acylase family protein [Geothrix limicola]GLH72142.1 peptidase [Geothrix limicola]
MQTNPNQTHPSRRWARWLFRTIAGAAGLVLVLVAALSAWFYARMRASLPRLDGTITVATLAAPVTIARDGLGIPTISGRNLAEVSFGLGFAHGQDRFFQMDLLRRNSAGELAELIGPALVKADRESRLHQFRLRAKEVTAAATPEIRAALEAYAKGVNEGLSSLRAKPFEYAALRVDPSPWLPEDTFLVMYSMYSDLSNRSGSRESNLGLMQDLLPRELFEAIAPPGTAWDAPLDGGMFPDPPLPGPDVMDLRKAPPTKVSGWFKGASDVALGSNNWAVAAMATADGRAILANDPHLNIGVPNTWYRASLRWQDPDGQARSVTGATLPGAPFVVIGSNGKVAWGFTNSYGDYSDIVLLETDPAQPGTYRTPDGPRRIETTEERIRVKGAADVLLKIQSTIWGPVMGTDHKGRLRAFSWTAHRPKATNMNLLGMSRAETLEAAIEAAHASGIPPQNCVIADAAGRIGWTIMGRIPRRKGFDGRVPVSWADGSRGWDGWLSSPEIPTLLDPPAGRLWTANARPASGEMLRKLGDGGYVLGARARQIRDDLFQKARLDERDLLAIQLDDRSLFLQRWRDLALKILTAESLKGKPQRAEFRKLLETNWTGHASIDSAGYRMARGFHVFFEELVIESLLAPCKQADPTFDPILPQDEGFLWRLATEQPAHLLDANYASWNEAMLAAVDRAIDYFLKDSRSLAQATLGSRNLTQIRHPLSRAIPMVGWFLDMDHHPLPGDNDMPRVQWPAMGASLRMVVSPGHEADGTLHMPCGQCGNPLSPHYRDGHEAWEQGKPTTFLPGPTQHTLVLTPRQLNSALKQQEYAESYVMEGMARELLKQSPALKAEFEQRKSEDKAFAANPEAILNWFYAKSPYWDQRVKVYPVGRITDETLLKDLMTK